MMTTRGWIYGAALTACTLCAGGASAEIYKSVDANGHVVFSQKPPQDAHSEIITPRYLKPPTPVPGGPAPFIPPNQPGALPSATDPPAKPKELTAEQQAAKQKNCEIARERLAQLQQPRGRRLQYKNEKDELAFLTQDMLEERIKDAQIKIVENCTEEQSAANAAPVP